LPPEQALRSGRWVKLICGASNQDLAAIVDLCGIYTLAGVQAIDVAADPAVVAAARRGIAWGLERSAGGCAPWLMLSLSDGADPHFRKAHFDPERCPPSCPRPCARVCPALAIGDSGGVIDERCYGCGRCLPACPLGLIAAREHALPAEAVTPLLGALRPDAVEIHTQPGRGAAFAQRLDQVMAARLPLQRLSVSCGWEAPGNGRRPPGGHGGDGSGADSAGVERAEAERAGVEGLAAELWQRFARLRAAGLRPLWQLDGRPMSGDVGDGTAHAAVRLLAALRPWAPPGPLQLAGGTNGHTLELLRRLAGSAAAARRLSAGVAFGGMARRQLQPLLVEAERRGTRLLDDADLWPEALARARELVGPWLAC
jgi:Fe-S-cluster-containing hydrogenase component 2